MIVQHILIPNYYWHLIVLYNCNCADNSSVIQYLQSIDCSKKLLDDANDNIKSCRLNIGLTYSNFFLRRSVMVIGKTTSRNQFINTVTHEVYHLIRQMSKMCNIKTEEEQATLSGDVNMQLYPVLHILMQDKV